MKLYDFEVNPYTYKNFKTEQLKNFQSMLKLEILRKLTIQLWKIWNVSTRQKSFFH